MVLEHRFYGMSQPFSDGRGGWSTDNFKLLNTSQAMQDIYYFIEAMKGPNQKVVIIGGSYPGALVAWYQNHFSNVDAVWSSSGVVAATEDFTGMDKVVVEATSK
jgi:pimeloyl-ACP methyl ester carboxylesterase